MTRCSSKKYAWCDFLSPPVVEMNILLHVASQCMQECDGILVLKRSEVLLQRITHSFWRFGQSWYCLFALWIHSRDDCLQMFTMWVFVESSNTSTNDACPTQVHQLRDYTFSLCISQANPQEPPWLQHKLECKRKLGSLSTKMALKHGWVSNAKLYFNQWTAYRAIIECPAPPS